MQLEACYPLKMYLQTRNANLMASIIGYSSILVIFPQNYLEFFVKPNELLSLINRNVASISMAPLTQHMPNWLLKIDFWYYSQFLPLVDQVFVPNYAFYELMVAIWDRVLSYRKNSKIIKWHISKTAL